jgi:RecA/RadA recombinase
MISTSTAEQASMTQEQQYVTQADMTVVGHLATSTAATELINQVSSTSHAVVTSLHDTSVQDQYVQQPDYQV